MLDTSLFEAYKTLVVLSNEQYVSSLRKKALERETLPFLLKKRDFLKNVIRDINMKS